MLLQLLGRLGYHLIPNDGEHVFLLLVGHKVARIVRVTAIRTKGLSWLGNARSRLDLEELGAVAPSALASDQPVTVCWKLDRECSRGHEVSVAGAGGQRLPSQPSHSPNENAKTGAGVGFSMQPAQRNGLASRFLPSSDAITEMGTQIG